jgi:hypothetical protein
MGNAESAQGGASALPVEDAVAATPAFDGDAKKTLSRTGGLISPDAGAPRASSRQSKQLQTTQIDDFLREKAVKHFISQNGREPSVAEKQEIQEGLEKSFTVNEMCAGTAEEETEAEQLVLKLVSSKLGGEAELTETQLQLVLDKLKEVAGPLKKDMNAREKEEAAVRKYLEEKSVQRFIEENSRPPTDQEKKELIESLDESFSSTDLVGKENTDGEDGSGEVAAEILVFNRLCSTFEQIQGRSPKEAELQEILEKLQQEVQVRLSPQKAAKEATEATEEASESTAEETSAGADGILQQLLEAYKQQNGKEPTEDVVKQWITVISEANLDMNAIAGGAEASPDGKRKPEDAGSGAAKRQRQ